MMPQNVSKTSSEKPLLGAVLCCTSVPTELRTQLAEWAVQMGAEHRLDLTSDVTHLLVGDTQTAKYQYVAKQRSDVKVLLPEFVHVLRDRWMQDDVLDLYALEAAYKVPIFAGLKICITGFEDLNFRAQLQDGVNKNGGVYTGDLTKDVTHLIAHLAVGKKYEYATMWGKKVVSLKWYHDTMQRGMQLSEESYHPSIDPEKQGLGAWEKDTDREGEKSGTSLGKRQRGTDGSGMMTAQEPNRKLRRTASARLGSQSSTIWNDIVRPLNAQTDTSSREALRPSKSMSDIKMENASDRTASARGEGGFLSGAHFVVHAFEPKQLSVITSTISAHEGTLHQSIGDLLEQEDITPEVRYLLVPHRIKRQKLQALKKVQREFQFVTELWLEWCITSRKLIPINQYPLGRPLLNNEDDDQMSKLIVNATGFPSIQTLHISKAITCLGGTYREVFTPEQSVLICDSTNLNTSKLVHAAQWKVPAVSESWLWKLIQDGKIPSFKSHLVRHDYLIEDDFRTRPPSRPRSAPPKNKAPTPDPSFHTQETVVIPSKSKTGSRSGSDSQMSLKSQQSGTAVPLKEMSVNFSPKRRSPVQPEGKKKLFRTFDGSSTIQDDSSVAVANAVAMGLDATTGDAINSISGQPLDLMAEFLQFKAEKEAQAAADLRKNTSKNKDPAKKHLLGRALSNLSNSSRTSNNHNTARKSRASSIDSINTDGLGVEVSGHPGFTHSSNYDPTTRQDQSTAKTSFSLMGRAKSSMTPQVEQSANSTDQEAQGRPFLRPNIDLNDPGFLRDEYPGAAEEPQCTQLGYEESEEAIALREKLAERKRARGRLERQEDDAEPEANHVAERKLRDKEKRVIKDDEALLGLGVVGGGRRTRQKEKLLNMNMESAVDVAGRGNESEFTL